LAKHCDKTGNSAQEPSRSILLAIEKGAKSSVFDVKNLEIDIEPKPLISELNDLSVGMRR
jgi:hypothetical protein